MTSPANKTVIITGGNSGLGYHCARALAADPAWHVVLACRNLETAQAAAERVRKASGNPAVDVMALDLASLADVRRFAAEVGAAELPPLRALVCNAGIQMTRTSSVTEDGFETTFAVNHLGHFLLANLLVDQLAAPARIVFVSSGTHSDEITTGMPKPRYADFRALSRGETGGPAESPGKAGRRLYSTSKLLNLFCTYEMSRRLQDRGITVNAFDPGLMPGTGLARDYGAVQRAVWRYVMPALQPFHPMISSAKRSGRGLARLAADPELADVNAAYFLIDKQSRSSKASQDAGQAAALWDVSTQLAGI